MTVGARAQIGTALVLSDAAAVPASFTKDVKTELFLNKYLHALEHLSKRQSVINLNTFPVNDAMLHA